MILILSSSVAFVLATVHVDALPATALSGDDHCNFE